MKEDTLIYILIWGVWFANINDLIRGAWFFQSVGSIMFWNILAIVFFVVLIMEKDSDIKRR